MRILLVEPSDRSVPGLNFGGLFINEPMSLELIAAAVPEHEVKIVDLRLDPNALEHYLYEFKPDVVGVTGITALHNEMNRILAQAKGAGAFTVAGGPHASFAYEALTNLDAIVVGEGEDAFRRLIDTLSRDGDLSSVPNLVWQDEGEYKENPREVPTLWPLPRRCFARGYHYSAFGNPTAMVEATRGCPHRCNFCVTPKLFHGRYRVRDVDEIVEYIGTRVEPTIWFNDPDFMASTKYIASLLEAIKKARLRKKWSISLRADEVCSNPELIREWSSVGLSFVFVGFEGYSQEQLDLYKKDSLLEFNKRCVSILEENNIVSIGTILVDPAWSTRQFDECLSYARKLRSNITLFSVLTPFPGTAISSDYKAIASYDKFDNLHAVTQTALPYKDFQRNLCRISKAVLLGKATLKLSWKLLLRGVINMSVLSSALKLWGYITRIDRRL